MNYGSINKPFRWQFKPPAGTLIDFTQPVTKNLIYFMPLNESKGLPTDIISGNISIKNTANWISNQWGSALSFNGANSVNIGNNTQWLSVTGPFTLMVYCSLSSLASQQAILGFYNRSGSPNYNGIEINYDANSFNKIALYSVCTNGAFYTYAGSPADTNFHIYAGSQYNLLASGCSLYVDGQLSGQSTAAYYPGAYNGTRCLGSESNGISLFKGVIGWAAMWARALTPWEHNFLGSNPNSIWQLFKPQIDYTTIIQRNIVYSIRASLAFDLAGDTGLTSGKFAGPTLALSESTELNLTSGKKCQLSAVVNNSVDVSIAGYNRIYVGINIDLAGDEAFSGYALKGMSTTLTASADEIFLSGRNTTLVANLDSRTSVTSIAGRLSNFGFYADVNGLFGFAGQSSIIVEQTFQYNLMVVNTIEYTLTVANSLSDNLTISNNMTYFVR